jgi:hypothetical protein
MCHVAVTIEKCSPMLSSFCNIIPRTTLALDGATHRQVAASETPDPLYDYEIIVFSWPLAAHLTQGRRKAHEEPSCMPQDKFSKE